ncbi:ABC transporter substrate-binding protein [Marinobacterium sedimentorum]|uniref:ABC transporter substrate-binding protein n=1 Tax=Marinobacterium sedimentorum TaxID=2927804 RepID=UPI0020C6ACCB|nr:ABC transporter substrate-binding protein [Marinobacterium sedimentorum]MCP8686731.1 ABC transporter substrate-binding protein [Marinobacterium sedimentorum]
MIKSNESAISAGLLALSLLSLGVAVGVLSRPTILPQLSIAVSRTPLSAPVYIAAAQGYFRDQGVDIELQEVIGGNRSYDLMANGGADLATSSESVVMFHSFDNSDFSVIASFASSDNDIKLITTTNSPLRSPYDLTGARVAVTPHSSSEYFLHNVALMHGIDTRTLNLRETTPENMTLELLESGEIQALSLWEPYGYKLMQALGEKAVLLPTKGLHSTSFNLLALNDTLARYPNAIVATLRALDQAAEYIERDPAGAKTIIRRQLQLEPAFVEWVWPDYNFRLGLGQSLLIGLDSAARWAQSSGAIEPQPLPDFRSMLDNRFLRQITPEAQDL